MSEESEIIFLHILYLLSLKYFPNTWDLVKIGLNLSHGLFRPIACELKCLMGYNPALSPIT